MTMMSQLKSTYEISKLIDFASECLELKHQDTLKPSGNEKISLLASSAVDILMNYL